MNLNFVQHSCAMNVLHAYIFPDVHLLCCREATEMSCFYWPVLQSFYQRAMFKTHFFSPSGVVTLKSIKAHKRHKIITLFLLDIYEVIGSMCTELTLDGIVCIL